RHRRLQRHRGRMARGAHPPRMATAPAAQRPGRHGLRRPNMLIDFFLHLRNSKLPVSIKEYLMLLEAMKQHVIGPSIDDFYFLSRSALVKDERNFDKFDKAFGLYFKGVI